MRENHVDECKPLLTVKKLFLYKGHKNIVYPVFIYLNTVKPGIEAVF